MATYSINKLKSNKLFLFLNILRNIQSSCFLHNLSFLFTSSLALGGILVGVQVDGHTYFSTCLLVISCAKLLCILIFFTSVLTILRNECDADKFAMMSLPCIQRSKNGEHVVPYTNNPGIVLL